MNIDLKKCPDCAEEVRAEARKCRFCGFIFSESTAEVIPSQSEQPEQPEEPEPHEAVPHKSFKRAGTFTRLMRAFGALLTTPIGGDTPRKADLDSAMVCPHCQVRGHVTTKAVKLKKGISGAKVTGAMATVGLSLWVTGLSRKEDATEARCSYCGSVWHF